jgi:hypothetical protein
MNETSLRLASFLAAACACPAAGAVTVDFDGLANSTIVSDEFLGLGAKFVGDFFVSNGTFGGAVVVPSPPNYVAVGFGPPKVLFVDPAKPLRPATTTSVSITTPALSGGCFDGFDLDAYDVDGTFIGSATAAPVAAPGGPQSTTTLTLAGIREVRFVRIETGCVAPFDNLVFTAVVPVDIFSDGFEDAN